MSLRVKQIFDVAGKIVVVTGGGAGIGKMIAQGYVENGAHVYIVSRKKAKCDATAAELSAIGPGKCFGFGQDLSSVSGVRNFAAQLRDAGVEKIDVLVNNSGATWGEPLEKHSEMGWDKIMNINLKGMFFLIQALLPELKAAATHQRPGAIINIGSVVGLEHAGIPTFGYDVSKAAVHHLTKKLATDLAQHHITCNCIAPGLVETKMGKQTFIYADKETYTGTMIGMGRTGEAADMAGIALLFGSKAGSWISGAVIPVDGGQLQHRMGVPVSNL